MKEQHQVQHHRIISQGGIEAEGQKDLVMRASPVGHRTPGSTSGTCMQRS